MIGMQIDAIPGSNIIKMSNVSPSFELHSPAALDPLLQAAGNASVVMLGEASHGTHEYYTWRAAISKRLIQEHDFSFIAVEGDWPDCYRINRYVKGYPDSGKNIEEVLHAFDRWPTWMWANWEVAALAEWLKEHNASLPMQQRVGFYGLDVYSLWESMETIYKYLEKEDPVAARAVKKAIKCFEPYGQEGQLYGRNASLLTHSCRNEVLSMLTEIRLKAQHYNGEIEAGLNAEQNAYIAVNAEKYYRSMMGFDDSSWNIRDTHMMETLQRLMKFHGAEAKGLVWEHNTHIGDARYTDMKRAGMVNTGQLGREKYGDSNVYLVGFGSYEGSVIAAEEWGATMQQMEVPPARQGSLEAMLHAEGGKDRLIIFDREDKRFAKDIPHRAIGVVYNPEREKYGNYVPSLVSSRYDAFIYLDVTKGLHAFHLHPDGSKTPDTYPFGV
jgi:erythromycin esterase